MFIPMTREEVDTIEIGNLIYSPSGRINPVIELIPTLPNSQFKQYMVGGVKVSGGKHIMVQALIANYTLSKEPYTPSLSNDDIAALRVGDVIVNYTGKKRVIEEINEKVVMVESLKSKELTPIRHSMLRSHYKRVDKEGTDSFVLEDSTVFHESPEDQSHLTMKVATDSYLSIRYSSVNSFVHVRLLVTDKDHVIVYDFTEYERLQIAHLEERRIWDPKDHLELEILTILTPDKDTLVKPVDVPSMAVVQKQLKEILRSCIKGDEETLAKYGILILHWY